MSCLNVNTCKKCGKTYQPDAFDEYSAQSELCEECEKEKQKEEKKQ